MLSSEMAPCTAAKLAELFPQYMDQRCYRIVTGEKEVVLAIMEKSLGHICYTGSSFVGKQVMASAAKTMTPVTLECGGKTPVIISSHTNMKLTAKRVMWGKFMNAGQ